MKANEAIAILHDYTEGRHSLTGEESQEIEWLLIDRDNQIAELKEYNGLLKESLDAVFPIAAIHGYKEPQERIDKGIEIRLKLNKH